MGKTGTMIGMVLALVAVVNAGGCVAATGEDVAAAEAELVVGSSAVGETPIDTTVGSVLVTGSCPSEKLWFDGRCRRIGYFERFVTSGAVLIGVQGTRWADDLEAILVFEAPNARTARVRVFDAQRPRWLVLGRRYVDGFELVGELTITSWVDENGYQHEMQTLEERDGSRFATTWWEHSWWRYGVRYYQGTDTMVGDELGTASDGIASSSGSSSDHMCELEGDAAGARGEVACTAVVSIVAGLAGASAAALTGGGALAIFAAGAGAGFGSGAATYISNLCGSVGDYMDATAELQCLQRGQPDEDGPCEITTELETPASQLLPGSDCAALGGTVTQSDTVVRSCDATASSSGSTTQVTMSADDDAAYEITVYGDPLDDCVSTVVPAGTCIVITG